MLSRFITLALLLALTLTHTTPSFAQTQTAAGGSWSAVQALTPGEKVVVRTKEGQKLEGRFEEASEHALVIKRDGETTSVERARIWRVSHKGGTSRSKGALVGAAIGGGAGTGFGGWLYQQGHGEFVKGVIPMGSLVGAGIGAGIGVAFGMGKKDIIVYEAQ